MSTEDSNRVTRYLLQRQPAHALLALEAAFFRIPANPIYNRLTPAKDAAIPSTLRHWTTYSPALLSLLKLSLTVYASLGQALTREELLDELDRIVTASGADAPKANEVAAVRHAAEAIRSKEDGLDGCGEGDIVSSAFRRCQEQLDLSVPWPPSLVRTLVLAALKLDASSPTRATSARSRRDRSANARARCVVEDWLAQLDDDIFIYWTTRRGRTTSANLAASTSSTDSLPGSGAPAELDRFRKDYLAVIELYLLEILPRQGDWDLANEFLREEAVLGAKGKERLFRKLHAVKQKHEQATVRSEQTTSRSDTPTSEPRQRSGGADGRDTAHGSPSRSRRSSVDTESTVKPVAPGNAGRRARPGGREPGPFDRQGRYTSGGYDVGDLRASLGNIAGPATASSQEQDPDGSEKRPQEALESPMSPNSRKVGNFALLRRRLNDFLDEPMQAPSSSATSTSVAPTGRRPPIQPRDVLPSLGSYAKDRWKPLLTVAFLVLLIARAGRRGAIARATPNIIGLTSASIASLVRLYQAMTDPGFWVSLAGQAWMRMIHTIKMGVTITYV